MTYIVHLMAKYFEFFKNVLRSFQPVDKYFKSIIVIWVKMNLLQVMFYGKIDLIKKCVGLQIVIFDYIYEAKTEVCFY